jgi:hypothetical protein
LSRSSTYVKSSAAWHKLGRLVMKTFLHLAQTR